MTGGEIDEVTRHFDVVAEGITFQVRPVAEGHTMLRDEVRGFVVRVGHVEERFDRFEGELKAMLRISFADLEHRVRRWNPRSTASLTAWSASSPVTPDGAPSRRSLWWDPARGLL